MFFFFSDKLGCAGSILVSAVITLALFFMLSVLQKGRSVFRFGTQLCASTQLDDFLN